MEQKQNVLRFAATALFVAAISVSCTQKDSAKIQVQLKGMDNELIVLQEQRVSGTKIIDSIKLSGSGKFNYRFKLKQPGFYNISLPDKSTIFLLLSPGNKVSVTANYVDKITKLKINGSPESEKLNFLYDSLFAVRLLLKDIRQKYTASENEPEKMMLNDNYVKILDDYRKFSMQFVLENLTSLLSVAALYQEVGPEEFVFGRKRDLQFFKIATDSLTKYFPKHRYVITLQQNYAQLMSTMQLEQIINKVGDVGVGLPNLQLPGFSGDLISLNAMKERYVLLNFWHNKDEISTNLFPSLKKIFDKYHTSNFNIYNVYLGKSDYLWEKIVHFEEIEKWVNVADTAYPYSQSRMVYNVITIPSNYLIDFKENTILAKDIDPQQLNQFLNNTTH
jgi:hypothetical protein